jgi:uncharacterized protein YlaI
MSTAHTGDHCAVKDKMCLTEPEANGILKRMKGKPMHKYKCEVCGHWHISSNISKRLRKQRKQKRK